MVEKIQKYGYLEVNYYDALVKNIKHISRNIQDCGADVDDLNKLHKDKQKEMATARKFLSEIKQDLSDLNGFFMKDLLAAEKQQQQISVNNSNIKTTSQTTKKGKQLRAEREALANLHKNITDIKQRLNEL